MDIASSAFFLMIDCTLMRSLYTFLRMKYRYLLYIEFLGTQYAGWQKQPDQTTIQEVIENVLEQVLQQRVSIYGQGRTDAGVHALYQVAHFDCNRQIDTYKLKYAFLGLLPRDIAVWDIKQVKNNFHARFDALERHYHYNIITQPSAFFSDRAELILKNLDLQSMQKCSSSVIGKHDFRNFSKEDDRKNYICSIKRSSWSKENGALTFSIAANRFLRHLVRRLVGTMIEVGLDKKSLKEFNLLLNDPNTSVTPHMAAAKGLTLTKVLYQD